MSIFNVRLPVSLHAELKAVAGEEGVSMNQWILMAVAEKLAARRVQKQLAGSNDLAARQQKMAGRSRAERRTEFLDLMSERAKETPVEGDEWPAALSSHSNR